MHILASLLSSGAHPAGWRLASEPPGIHMRAWRHRVRALEAAGVDAVLLGQSSGGGSLLQSGMADALAGDPLPMLGALIAATQHIGLGACVSVSRTEPFHTARAFAVLDLLSMGRTAWLVGPICPDGRAQLDDPALPALGLGEPYARAAEYIDVAIKLWDSWEDGAILADKPSGVFADSSRVHPIDHEGPYFSVRGPLTAIRPPQGRSVIIQSDLTEDGIRLAGKTADVVLLSPKDVPRAHEVRDRLRAEAELWERSGPRLIMNVVPVLGTSHAAALGAAQAMDDLLDEPLAVALIADRWKLQPALEVKSNRLGQSFSDVYGRAPPTGPADATLRDVAQLVLDARGVRLVGTPQMLAAQMRSWVDEGLCDGFNLLPSVLPNDLELLLTGLLPALRPEAPSTQSAPRTLRERLGLTRPRNVMARQ